MQPTPEAAQQQASPPQISHRKKQYRMIRRIRIRFGAYSVGKKKPHAADTVTVNPTMKRSVLTAYSLLSLVNSAQ